MAVRSSLFPADTFSFSEGEDSNQGASPPDQTAGRGLAVGPGEKTKALDASGPEHPLSAPACSHLAQVLIRVFTSGPRPLLAHPWLLGAVLCGPQASLPPLAPSWPLQETLPSAMTLPHPPVRHGVLLWKVLIPLEL